MRKNKEKYFFHIFISRPVKEENWKFSLANNENSLSRENWENIYFENQNCAYLQRALNDDWEEESSHCTRRQPLQHESIDFASVLTSLTHSLSHFVRRPRGAFLCVPSLCTFAKKMKNKNYYFKFFFSSLAGVCVIAK
jgi:hypothetical protein